MLKMSQKNRKDVEDYIRLHMCCICITQEKDAVSAIWALKFEQKDSKLRVVQIKDMK